MSDVKVLMFYKVKPEFVKGREPVWFVHYYTTASTMTPFFVPVSYSQISEEEHCFVLEATRKVMAYERTMKASGHMFRESPTNKLSKFGGKVFLISEGNDDLHNISSGLYQSCTDELVHLNYTQYLKIDLWTMDNQTVFDILSELA